MSCCPPAGQILRDLAAGWLGIDRKLLQTPGSSSSRLVPVSGGVSGSAVPSAGILWAFPKPGHLAHLLPWQGSLHLCAGASANLCLNECRTPQFLTWPLLLGAQLQVGLRESPPAPCVQGEPLPWKSLTHEAISPGPRLCTVWLLSLLQHGLGSQVFFCKMGHKGPTRWALVKIKVTYSTWQSSAQGEEAAAVAVGSDRCLSCGRELHERASLSLPDRCPSCVPGVGV